ncbi:MAG: PRTRC system protein B [Terriglobia bacterium]
MKAYVNIGANHEFRLAQAVLVYRGGANGAFASLHQVKQAENGIPHLTPGEALTTAFLRILAQGLGAQVKPEILPNNVLARTPDMLVWWSPPQRRVMFFGGVDKEARKLNGLVFPHPALIFKVVGKDLLVRALATISRPTPETPLKMAPYWNTDSRGLVCAGSMRVPESSDIASISGWQDAYFQSFVPKAEN